MHHLCRQMSYVTVIIALSLAGRGWGAADLQSCIDEWRQHSFDCCDLPPEMIEPCLNTARDGLVACLKNLPPAQNKNCWSLFVTFLTTQCTGANAPCNTPLGRKAWREAGRTVYRWCIGLDPDDPVSVATLAWKQNPASVQVGNDYQLMVITNDPKVNQVRFFGIRLDAPATAADPVFEIGSAVATQFPPSSRVAWRLTTDTGDWPLDQGEQRVMIVARSEMLIGQTAAHVLDISTLIEVELE